MTTSRTFLRSTGALLALGLAACSGEVEPLGPQLVDLVPADASECAAGGVQVRVGLDDNADGILQDTEVTNSEFVCSGEDGAQGDPGNAGDPGDPGDPGVDGTNALIRTTEEAAGANCANGGLRVDVGLDDDGDGTLDDGEIDATSFVCNGLDGADGLVSLVATSTDTQGACASAGVRILSGLDDNGDGVLDPAEIDDSQTVCDGANGVDGAVSLVEVAAEPAGQNCLAGGQRITSGVDGDGDGALAGAEIADISYICDPLNNLVSVTAEAAGTSSVCAGGGSRIEVGLDTNGNGTLDTAEITQTSYACNGADGQNGQNGVDGAASLVTVTPEAAGANCAGGGQRIQSGPDTNGNGTLDANEIATTSYVCDGADGANGAPGQNGANGSLARVSVEPAGANCLNGGSRIETGPDLNFDGVLDPAEVTATSFACDGAARESLVISTPIAAGPQCATGGFRVDAGLDLDGNGTLEPAEITTTSFVCNGLAAVPFAIQTATLPNGTANQPYSATLTAAGGTGGNYTWSIAQGTLPPGLTLSPTGTPNATLNGNPTGGGQFVFTVQVTDFFGQAASRQYTVDIAGPELAITTFTLPRLDPPNPFSASLGATGGTAPYTWSVAQGSLPAGLSLTANGDITGAPAANQNADVLLRVTDNAGAIREARYVFRARRDFVGFAGDLTTDNVGEVYIAPLTAGVPGNPLTINPPPLATGDVGQTSLPSFTDMKVSASGDKAAFIGDLAFEGAEEIWYVDATTAAPPVKANPDFLASTQDVDTDDYGWSPDGRWLAYIADPVTDSEWNLFVVDTASAAPTALQVNGTLPTSGDVDTSDGFQFSPDSTMIAYISDENVAAVETLFVVDLTSLPLTPRQVSGGGADADVFAFRWTPDSTGLVFAGDELVDGVTELFYSNVAGAAPTAPVRLSAPIANASGDVGTSVSFDLPSDFEVSPDGQRVFYIADARTESVDELYVVELATPGAARLVSHDGRTNSGDDVDRAFWTPDSRNLVFVADTRVTAVLEVFLTGAAPGTSAVPVTLNAPFPTNGDVSQGFANFSTDEVVVDPRGRGVYFMADGLVDSEEELFFTAFASPGTMTNLSPNIAGSSDVNSFLVSKDGSLVVVSGDPSASAVDEIFSVAVTGDSFGAPQIVNGALVTSGDVDTGASSTSRDYDIVNDGEGVVYIADQLTDAVDEVFFTPINGGTPGASQSLLTPVTSGDATNVYR